MTMGIVSAVIFYTSMCSCMIYTFLIADPSTSTMSQLFTIKLPRLFTSLVLQLFGPNAVRLIGRSTRYFLATFYLIVVLGSWSVMFTYGYDWIDKSSPRHVSQNHKYSGYLLFIACIASWRKTRSTSPGNITPRTLPRYHTTYPYDDVLYPPGRTCPTVGIPRLPRSKFDRATRRHVPRFDHYCGWVDNAVGEENYRFFLSFLLVHVFMCGYGAVVAFWLFRGEVRDMDLMNAVYVDALEGIEIRADRWVVGNYMLRRRFEMAVVMILMGVMAVTLGMFLLFHLYIAARGMTTNEYYKWRQVTKWYKREKRMYEKAKRDRTLLIMEGEGGDRGGDKRIGELKDVDVGCVGPVATEPTSDTTVVPNNGADGDGPISDPGPYPINVYDLGIIENYREILFPRSLRKDAMDRGALSRYTSNRKKVNTATTTTATTTTTKKD